MLFDWHVDQLHQACEGAALRGSRVISAEDILFLMRRDKVNKKQSHEIFLFFFKRYKSHLYHLNKLNRSSFFPSLSLSFFLNVSRSEESRKIIKISPV